MKNQIIKLVFALTLAFTAFSCNNDGNNDEIVKLPTIVDIAKSNPDLSILVVALTKTGLATTFTSSGSYTVFAPTNAAFTAAGISEASISAMTAPQLAGLKLILQNHVLGVGTKAIDLLPNAALGITGYSRTFGYYKAKTTDTTGANLSMFVNQVGADVLVNGGSTNGGSKVINADIEASNGIIHTIGNILVLPTIVSQVKANPDLFSTLLTVLSGTSTVPGLYGDQSAILTGLTNALGESNTTSISLFAPTNAAFAKATASGGFLTNSTFFGTPALTATNIANVLKYHYQSGNFPSFNATSYSAATATNDQLVTTALGQSIKILKYTVKVIEQPVINLPASNMKVVNIQGTNGVIFAMDRVLQPVL